MPNSRPCSAQHQPWTLMEDLKITNIFYQKPQNSVDLVDFQLKTSYLLVDGLPTRNAGSKLVVYRRVSDGLPTGTSVFFRFFSDFFSKKSIYYGEKCTSTATQKAYRLKKRTLYLV